MNKKPPSVVKTLAWVYGAVSAFTAISIIGPVLLDRVQRGRGNERRVKTQK